VQFVAALNPVEGDAGRSRTTPVPIIAASQLLARAIANLVEEPARRWGTRPRFYRPGALRSRPLVPRVLDAYRRFGVMTSVQGAGFP
jgi:hypothetical protein